MASFGQQQPLKGTFSNGNKTYTVGKGDCLSVIASDKRILSFPEYSKCSKTTCYGKNNSLWVLCELNDIDYYEEANLIYIGQKLIISGSKTNKVTTKSSATGVTFKTNTPQYQADSDNVVFITWAFDGKYANNYYTSGYKYQWYYWTSDNVATKGSTGTTDDTTEKYCQYTIPSNAVKVRVEVTPISNTGSNNKNLYTATNKTSGYFFTKDLPPEKPGVPTVERKLTKLTTKLTGYTPDDMNEFNYKIEFEVFKDGETKPITNSGNIVALESDGSATLETTLDSGLKAALSIFKKYNARCRAIRKVPATSSVAAHNVYSDWSNYSDFAAGSLEAPTIESITARSTTEVFLTWSNVESADEYIVEYSSNEADLGTLASQTQSVKARLDLGPEVPTSTPISGLEIGKTYYFRVCAGLESDYSNYSTVHYITLGSNPTIPTTWSSTTTAISGESVTLYWMHNSEDDGGQTDAELELDIGDTKEIITNLGSEKSYSLDTTIYSGKTIKWRVRTKGLLDYLLKDDGVGYKLDENGNRIPAWSEYSIEKEITIHSQPVLSLSIGQLPEDEEESIYHMTGFPITIDASVLAPGQKPIGCYATITSNSYIPEAVDNLGNPNPISQGDIVYNKHYDKTSTYIDGDGTTKNVMSDGAASDLYSFKIPINVCDITLVNTYKYTLTFVVALNSGLTCESSIPFIVDLEETEWDTGATITYDQNRYITVIKPYCMADDVLYDKLISVYRRESDGTFTLIGSDMTSNTNVIDPHPALDYARYRIVSKDETTSQISYVDMDSIYIGEKSVILQWNEVRTTFDTLLESELMQPAYTGSLLKLSYNIDISDKTDPDVELIKYIGRSNPVAYYGTQVGETSTWNVDIDKSDAMTLSSLRRLSKYMGNVYVRSPHGVGYWATVKVSFNQTHLKLTVPVTLEITRVEGGA